jgi:hypothetical protein
VKFDVADFRSEAFFSSNLDCWQIYARIIKPRQELHSTQVVLLFYADKSDGKLCISLLKRLLKAFFRDAAWSRTYRLEVFSALFSSRAF